MHENKRKSADSILRSVPKYFGRDFLLMQALFGTEALINDTGSGDLQTETQKHTHCLVGFRSKKKIKINESGQA